MAQPPKDAIRLLVDNRRIRHEYTLEETFEAGLSLLGPEVKSIRAGNANLAEAWVKVTEGAAWLVGAHVSPYLEASWTNPEPRRERQLLLHHHELLKLTRGIRQKGMTVVPVRMYVKGSRIKLEIALARGKKLHDKRETLRKRDADRELARARR